MAIGKDIWTLYKTHGGLAGDYQDIIESDFAASAGTAYTPPEESNFRFRRVVASRDIQILAQCPVVIETFQTSSGILRLPANSVADSTNDAANGRLFLVKNSGTGSITIKDYLGTSLFSLPSALIVMAVSSSNNSWSFVFVARNTWFDNSTVGATGLVSVNIQGVIEELNQKISGGSGNIVSTLTFSKGGGCAVGSYLYWGSVVSSLSGTPTRGNNKILQIKITTSANVASDTVFQLQNRSAIGTFTDIVDATVTILAGNYKGDSGVISIVIGPNFEICAYNKSGVTTLNSELTVSMVPV